MKKGVLLLALVTLLFLSEFEEKYAFYYQNPSEAWMPLGDYLARLLKEGFNAEGFVIYG